MKLLARVCATERLRDTEVEDEEEPLPQGYRPGDIVL